jgi:hypothetical protein
MHVTLDLHVPHVGLVVAGARISDAGLPVSPSFLHINDAASTFTGAMSGQSLRHTRCSPVD